MMLTYKLLYCQVIYMKNIKRCIIIIKQYSIYCLTVQNVYVIINIHCFIKLLEIWPVFLSTLAPRLDLGRDMTYVLHGAGLRIGQGSSSGTGIATTRIWISRC